MTLSLIRRGPDAIAHLLPSADPESIEALYRSPRPGWVRANMLVSLDAAVEIGGRSGALGGPDDRPVPHPSGAPSRRRPVAVRSLLPFPPGVEP